MSDAKHVHRLSVHSDQKLNNEDTSELPPSDTLALASINSAFDSSAVDNEHRASPDSAYATYACRVDRNEGDRAVEITLCSFARPHMRAFHFAWMSFFISFFSWFAVTPLLHEIKETLQLSKAAIWNSTICAVAGGVLFRILVGPLCDR